MPGKRWARRDACRAGRLRAASEERLGCTPSLKRELPMPIPWRGFVSGRRAAEGRHPCWQGLGQRSVGHAPELKNACAAGRDIAPRCVKLAGGARVDPARPPSPAPSSRGASASAAVRLTSIGLPSPSPFWHANTSWHAVTCAHLRYAWHCCVCLPCACAVQRGMGSVRGCRHVGGGGGGGGGGN